MAKGKSKRVDKNQMMFDLFNKKLDRIMTLEGGGQEELSPFEYRLRMLLKVILEDAAKRAADPLSRAEVAARMTKLLGRKITKDRIDMWVAMSAVQHRIHLDSLKALCEVTGDYRALYYFVESCGYKALEPEEAFYADYGFKMYMRRMIDTDIKEAVSNADETSLRKNALKRLLNGGSNGSH